MELLLTLAESSSGTRSPVIGIAVAVIVLVMIVGGVQRMRARKALQAFASAKGLQLQGDELRGVYGSTDVTMRVESYSGGSSRRGRRRRHYKTRFNAVVRAALPAGFQLQRKDLLARAVNALSSNSMQIGDPELDRHFVAGALIHDQARMLLAYPGLRDTLLHLASKGCHVVISPAQVGWTVDREVIDVQQVEGMLRDLDLLAAALQNASIEVFPDGPQAQMLQAPTAPPATMPQRRDPRSSP